MDFTLEKDVLELEGVTVTGQATTVHDKKNASTAIASVSAEELTKVPTKSTEGALAGKVTVVGATVFENSGVPGGGMQVQIRGATLYPWLRRPALRRRRRDHLQCLDSGRPRVHLAFHGIHGVLAGSGGRLVG